MPISCHAPGLTSEVDSLRAPQNMEQPLALQLGEPASEVRPPTRQALIHRFSALFGNVTEGVGPLGGTNRVRLANSTAQTRQDLI